MIDMRWMKLHSDSPDKAPKLQWREMVGYRDDGNGGREPDWTPWQSVPLRFVTHESQETGVHYSDRHAD